MKTISGFTFIHNALEGGYPIVEAIRAVERCVDEIVIVDMQSTDGTREILERLDEPFVNKSGMVFSRTAEFKIINGHWGNQAGETLRQAHKLYRQCSGDVIIHFEGDEVYETELLDNIIYLIKQGIYDIAVHRIQLEQNFQRCRWYPGDPVHRVFPRTSHTRKEGHTTTRHDQATVLGPENGYLWDITNCFRDNWMNRVKKQAELRDDKPQYLMVPIHCTLPANLSEHDAQQWIYGGRHWEWTNTPFAIPEILRPLVGMTKYEAKI
jgi:glycosyltransferase involved in cell wall biosynthesis